MASLVKLDAARIEVPENVEEVSRFFTREDGPMGFPSFHRLSSVLRGCWRPQAVKQTKSSASCLRAATRSVWVISLSTRSWLAARAYAGSDRRFRGDAGETVQPALDTGHNPSGCPPRYRDGPIRERLSFNSGSNVFGPGNQTNATIGRATRLILPNVGGAKPGILDLATQGQPSKYSFCIAKNEEMNPWEPLQVERGFEGSSSTVTVCGVENPHNINA
jgi:hypothetical protein